LEVQPEYVTHCESYTHGLSKQNITITYSERYQTVARAAELLGFGYLSRIVGTSEWLETTFRDQSTTTFEIWMQTTFLTKFKPILCSGQQKKLEINNYVLPANLADDIEENVVYHFDRVVDWSIGWFNERTERTRTTLKVCRPDCGVRTG
jgi:hypothetical protein